MKLASVLAAALLAASTHHASAQSDQNMTDEMSAQQAAELHHGDLVLSGLWTRATAGAAPTGVGYLTIENRGAAADRLVGVETPIASRAEIHSMTMEKSVMRMRPVEGGLEIPAGKSVTLAPGGLHLMLVGLNNPIAKGDHVPLVLEFAGAGRVDVTLHAAAIGAREPDSAHSLHTGGEQ